MIFIHFLEFFLLPEDDRHFFLNQIRLSDWRGAWFLHDLLCRNALDTYSGPGARLLLLAQDRQIVSFCVLGPRDEIHDTHLSPWIGFVYTFPRYRGHRYSEAIINQACSLANAAGHSKIYISSNECGLYEKYDFRLLGYMPNVRGEETQVFVRDL